MAESRPVFSAFCHNLSTNQNLIGDESQFCLTNNTNLVQQKNSYHFCKRQISVSKTYFKLFQLRFSHMRKFLSIIKRELIYFIVLKIAYHHFVSYLPLYCLVFLFAQVVNLMILRWFQLRLYSEKEEMATIHVGKKEGEPFCGRKEREYQVNLWRIRLDEI